MNGYNGFFFFVDPLYFAPIVGTLFVALSASQVGVLLVEKRESQIAEALSHTAYPGILLSILLMGLLGEIRSSYQEQIAILIGALVSTLAGLLFLRVLQRGLQMSQDVSLCLALSLFFGVGVLAGSQIQFFFPTLYRAVPLYLFGQAATMTKSHLLFLIPASLLVLFLMQIFYKEWKWLSFDAQHAEIMGIDRKKFSALFYFMVLLSLILGMRSCGILLMSALFIMPPIIAKQISTTFSQTLLYSALFSQLGAFLGIMISIFFPSPTGPSIVLTLSIMAFVALWKKMGSEKGQ